MVSFSIAGTAVFLPGKAMTRSPYRRPRLSIGALLPPSFSPSPPTSPLSGFLLHHRRPRPPFLLLPTTPSMPPPLPLLVAVTRAQCHHLCFASADTGGGGLCISDGELESRSFRVRRTAARLDVEALNKVFVRVGFPRWEPVRIWRPLEHAGGAVVWVEEAKQKAEGRPVAFARATGDGVFNAPKPERQGGVLTG